MNFQTMSKQRKFVLVAAAAGIIGMFLPWVDLGPFGSVNGMRGKGILIFLCFAGAGVLSYIGDQTKVLERNFWFITLLCGALATLIMVWGYFNMDNSFFGARSVLGVGFYLAAIAAIAVLVFAYIFRAPGDNIKDGFDSVKDSFSQKPNTPPSE